MQPSISMVSKRHGNWDPEMIGASDLKTTLSPLQCEEPLPGADKQLLCHVTNSVSSATRKGLHDCDNCPVLDGVRKCAVIGDANSIYENRHMAPQEARLAQDVTTHLWVIIKVSPECIRNRPSRDDLRGALYVAFEVGCKADLRHTPIIGCFTTIPNQGAAGPLQGESTSLPASSRVAAQLEGAGGQW